MIVLLLKDEKQTSFNKDQTRKKEKKYYENPNNKGNRNVFVSWVGYQLISIKLPLNTRLANITDIISQLM